MRRRSEIDQALHDLERQGEIVKTGGYRPNREGILEPVYVTREIYQEMYEGHRASKKAGGQCRRPMSPSAPSKSAPRSTDV